MGDTNIYIEQNLWHTNTKNSFYVCDFMSDPLEADIKNDKWQTCK